MITCILSIISRINYVDERRIEYEVKEEGEGGGEGGGDMQNKKVECFRGMMCWNEKIRCKRKKNRWKWRGKWGAGLKELRFPRRRGGRRGGATRTIYIYNVFFLYDIRVLR